MTRRFHDWQPAGDCSSGPRPGTVATLAALLDTFEDTYSLGIYNCRTVRGSTSRSVHGEGRALDLGIPMSGGRATARGHEIVDRVAAAAWELGVTLMVYDRTKWGANYPGGAAYGGTHPHYDHLHMEQTRHHAETLTYATVMSHLKEPSMATRTYAQAIVGYSSVDIENGRPLAAGYELAMVTIDDGGNLHSVTHPGDRAEVTDWAGVVGGRAVSLYGTRTPRTILSGRNRDETSRKVFAFIRKHDPRSWPRRGVPA